MPRTYAVQMSAASLTAAATSIFEHTNGAAISTILVRATLTQILNTTSTQQGIQITQQSTWGTSVVTPNVRALDKGDAAAGLVSRGMCTTQGTIGNILHNDAFNWQNGWVYLPVPEERICQGGAAIWGLRTNSTPPAFTSGVNAQMNVMEIGA